MKLLLTITALIAFISCATTENKWGKEFDENGKWWKQEGQNFDINTKIFMAVGMSHGKYNNKRLERDSADIDARKQAINFLESQVTNYVKELNANGTDTNESMVRAISQEILVGTVIIDRHYDEPSKLFYSLMKVDLSRIFETVKNRTNASEKYTDLR